MLLFAKRIGYRDKGMMSDWLVNDMPGTGILEQQWPCTLTESTDSQTSPTFTPTIKHALLQHDLLKTDEAAEHVHISSEMASCDCR